MLTWLRSNFSAVFRSFDWAFSRCLRRAITVRRLRAGVPPSNTNTGLVRRYSSLQIRRKKPSICALRTISPFSSRIAFMNCTIHMLASANLNSREKMINVNFRQVAEVRIRVRFWVYRWRAFFRLMSQRTRGGRRGPVVPRDRGLPFRVLLAENASAYSFFMADKPRHIFESVGTKTRKRCRRASLALNNGSASFHWALGQFSFILNIGP